MTLNGGELDGQRILSRKTIELMTTDHLGGIPFRDGQGFGLGFLLSLIWVREAYSALRRVWLGRRLPYNLLGRPAEELVVVYLTQLIPAQGIDDYSKPEVEFIRQSSINDSRRPVKENRTLRTLLSALLFTLCSQIAHAQLATPNGSGITYGHMHLNVSDIAQHIEIWTEHFGGEEISIGPCAP